MSDKKEKEKEVKPTKKNFWLVVGAGVVLFVVYQWGQASGFRSGAESHVMVPSAPPVIASPEPELRSQAQPIANAPPAAARQSVPGTNPQSATARQPVTGTNPQPAARQPVAGTDAQVIETEPVQANSQRKQSVAKPVTVLRDPSDLPKPATVQRDPPVPPGAQVRRFIDVQQPDGSYRLQELPAGTPSPGVPHPAPVVSVYDRPKVSPKPSELGLMPLVPLADVPPVSSATRTVPPVSATTRTVAPVKPSAIKFNCDCGKPH